MAFLTYLGVLREVQVYTPESSQGQAHPPGNSSQLAQIRKHLCGILFGFSRQDLILQPTLEPSNVAQAYLDFAAILLPQFPKYRDYRHELPPWLEMCLQ